MLGEVDWMHRHLPAADTDAMPVKYATIVHGFLEILVAMNEVCKHQQLPLIPLPVRVHKPH